MQVSATILGQEYGLTAEEMNRVLVKLGFLEGVPGDYNLTEKAIQYALEQDYHRGTGGYSCYNRYWTTRTFDDSIKQVLDVSSELIREVRDEIANDRAVRYAIQAAERAKANAEFLAKQAAEKAEREEVERAAVEAEEIIAKWKKVGKVGLIVGSVLIVGYSAYKVTPKIKKWWYEKKHANTQTKDEDDNDNDGIIER